MATEDRKRYVHKPEERRSDRAEIRRLRAALERIAFEDQRDGRFAEIARKALKD